MYGNDEAELPFEWDRTKATANVRKHGVTFEEACGVVYDDFARRIDDPIHSVDEERFVLLGMGSAFRLLVVVHSYRADGNTIRIISARKADASESALYR